MVYFYQNEIRRFFDNYIRIFYKDYRQELLKFRKILKERNAILKKKNPSKMELSIWDDFFIEFSKKIINKRKKFASFINKNINKYYQEIFNDNLSVKINYRTNFDKNQFKNSIEIDLEKKTTQIGPHRDKYRIIFNEKKLKVSASQGQMKSFIISFIMVITEKIKKVLSKDAVLLLDDILAELDKNRKKEIFKIVENFNLQCFFTGVDKSLFKKNMDNFYRLDSGRIIKENG